jgi:elongation factor Ts
METKSPEISSELVRKLRETTGAGMMECKRALESTGGDMEKAIKVLREKGAASAAKRAGRATAEGLVTSQIAADGKTAVLLDLNCETDFVARTDDFTALLKELVQGAADGKWKTPAEAPQQRIQDMIAKLGENITLRRFVRWDLQQPGVFAVYIHPSGGTGKVGVLLELSGADGAEAAELARNLAMQVAAASPRWVRREDVPAETVESEKAIGREQAKRENKPEKIWDKIAEGKLTQFVQQFCLLEQIYVRDGKTQVKAVLDEASKKFGKPLSVRRFARYKVGEEE